MTASAHPAPSTMARELWGESMTAPVPATRAAYTLGVEHERARVVADLRERALRIRKRDPNEYAMIVVAYLETYADEFEGKVTP